MSTSINPFHYAPQTDHASVLAAQKDFDLEHNEKSFSISKKDPKQMSSHIEGIGMINTMDDVAMTCANICGIQLAIINISPGKPLLYQFTWKLLKFIKNKKIYRWHACNAQFLVHLPFLFMGKLHQFFQIIASFSQIASTPTKSNTASRQATKVLTSRKWPLRLSSHQSF
jgi:hypothetical protein